MKEELVKKRVKVVLSALGIYWFMPTTHGYGHSGLPDIVGCFQGWFIGIECKGDGGRTTALQDRELERIRAAGGFAMVITPDNVDTLAHLLEIFIKEKS